MGPDFTAAKLPKTAALFDRVIATEDVVDERQKRQTARVLPADERASAAAKIQSGPGIPGFHRRYLMATRARRSVTQPKPFARALVAENRCGRFHYRSYRMSAWRR